MPSYKLTYFDVKGKAETARILFRLSGTKFEDVRFQRSEWPNFKPNTPYGQVPYLEVDDQKICQSAAINHFLAKKFGYCGESLEDETQILMYTGCIDDMMQVVGKLLFTPEDEEKKKLMDEAFNVKVPDFLSKLEKLVNGNNQDHEYFFVGKKLSYADLNFFRAIEIPKEYLNTTVSLEAYPRLQKIYNHVSSLSAIKQ